MEDKKPNPPKAAAAPKKDETGKPAPPPLKKNAKQKLGMMFIPTIIGMVGFFAFMLSAPFWATDAKEAEKVLVMNGYKIIKVGGFNPLGCGLDVYSTRYEAINPRGTKVKGSVCKTPHVNPPTIEEDDD